MGRDNGGAGYLYDERRHVVGHSPSVDTMKAVAVFLIGVAVGWVLTDEAARRRHSGIDRAYQAATVPMRTGGTWTSADGRVSTTWTEGGVWPD